jgi:hypothetical protein
MAEDLCAGKEEEDGESHMVTNYPRQLTASDLGTDSGGEPIVARAMTRLGQLLCGLRGHDAVLHFEGRRVMMRCTSCGHDTPGWETGERAPRRRFEGDARRHSMSAPAADVRRSA